MMDFNKYHETYYCLVSLLDDDRLYSLRGALQGDKVYLSRCCSNKEEILKDIKKANEKKKTTLLCAGEFQPEGFKKIDITQTNKIEKSIGMRKLLEIENRIIRIKGKGNDGFNERFMLKTVSMEYDENNKKKLNIDFAGISKGVFTTILFFYYISELVRFGEFPLKENNVLNTEQPRNTLNSQKIQKLYNRINYEKDQWLAN